MILDIWVLMPIVHFVGGSDSVSIPTQPLRVLRLFKLTRMARLLKAFPELVTMIKGLVRSLRAISSSAIMITLMLYIWGILVHMLLKDKDELNDKYYELNLTNFRTVVNCMWTLFL